jgi:hypothetical protein
MARIYLLEHFKSDDEYHERPRFIGVYREGAVAQAAIARLRPLPGFRDHPDGFDISECTLDETGWTEGFISWDEAST